MLLDVVYCCEDSCRKKPKIIDARNLGYYDADNALSFTLLGSSLRSLSSVFDLMHVSILDKTEIIVGFLAQ